MLNLTLLLFQVLLLLVGWEASSIAHSIRCLSLTQDDHMRSQDIYDTTSLRLDSIISTVYVTPGIPGPGGGVLSTVELDFSQGTRPIAD